MTRLPLPILRKMSTKRKRFLRQVIQAWFLNIKNLYHTTVWYCRQGQFAEPFKNVLAYYSK